MAAMTVLILAALASFPFVALIVVLILKWKDIIQWFRNRHQLKESDKANIAFTLNERLASGKYKVVRGIFNKRTSEILDAEQHQANELDEKLAEAHRDEDLVLYE
jgi:hypothetical protein